MKKIIIAATAVVVLSFQANAQSNDLPTTSVKDLKGASIPFNETFEKGKVTLVNFWATWCVPCKKEIKSVRDNMPAWKQEADFNYMTVSMDDSRATAQVKAYAKSQGWDFPTYLDPNSDLKRSLNFQNVPFTIIVDKEGKIAHMQSGYEAGGESVIFGKVKELVAR
jgi:thiol-disulfide isomerase/thioredoxin